MLFILKKLFKNSYQEVLVKLHLYPDMVLIFFQLNYE